MLYSETLMLPTSIHRVLGEQGPLQTELSARDIDDPIGGGAISSGMLPKTAGAIDAAKSGVPRCTSSTAACRMRCSWTS